MSAAVRPPRPAASPRAAADAGSPPGRAAGAGMPPGTVVPGPIGGGLNPSSTRCRRRERRRRGRRAAAETGERRRPACRRSADRAVQPCLRPAEAGRLSRRRGRAEGVHRRPIPTTRSPATRNTGSARLISRATNIPRPRPPSPRATSASRRDRRRAEDLLYLGMSLAKADQKKNACLALAQLDQAFPNPAAGGPGARRRREKAHWLRSWRAAR